MYKKESTRLANFLMTKLISDSKAIEFNLK